MREREERDRVGVVKRNRERKIERFKTIARRLSQQQHHRVLRSSLGMGRGTEMCLKEL